MAGFTQKPAPKVPTAKALHATAAEEFDTLKKSLNETQSWELSPNFWKDIQIIYVKGGKEETARSFLKAIELPTPEM